MQAAPAPHLSHETANTKTENAGISMARSSGLMLADMLAGISLLARFDNFDKGRFSHNGDASFAIPADRRSQSRRLPYTMAQTR
jgi:hypothetical protein